MFCCMYDKIVYVIYSFKTIKNSPGALWDQSRRVAFCPTGSAPGTPPVPRRSTGRHPLCVCRRRRCLCYCLIYLKIERLLLIIDLFGENYNAQLAKNKQTEIGTHTRTKRQSIFGVRFCRTINAIVSTEQNAYEFFKVLQLQSDDGSSSRAEEETEKIRSEMETKETSELNNSS